MLASARVLTSYYFVKSQVMTQHKEWEAGGNPTKKCQMTKKKLLLANIIVRKLETVVKLLLSLLKIIKLRRKLNLWLIFRNHALAVGKKNVLDKIRQ
ncbi:hypothetical protein D3C76_1458350 [compost metagenome]